MHGIPIRRLRSIAALATVVAFVACDDESRPSADVDTSNVSATYRVVADGAGAAVLTARVSAAGTPLELNDGDKFKAKIVDPATGRGERRQLARARGTLFSSPVYDTAFYVDADDSRIDVAFIRPNGRRDALRSAATLPTPFTLRWVEDPATEAPAAVPYSRGGGAPAFVIWDPFDAPAFDPGDTLAYRVSGTCVVTTSGAIDWPAGEDALDMADVIVERSSASGDDCDVTVTLELTREGQVDPVLRGGSFEASQTRSLTVLTTP